ncbi:MAG: tryptophan synthase subunit alpha [Phycisphaerae bacterium]|nr:tryptophan synthase subunit alpha [Phycisphaerae bacterium]
MKTYADVLGHERTALIPFFVLGDPDEETSFDVICAALDAGADVLELGIPFSDPIADGPVIQRADIRALNAGMTPEKALALIHRIKAFRDVPIGLLMYYNLIWQYGTDRFFCDAAAAGVNSVLVADLSIDDADEVCRPAQAAGMDTVFMVTPNTPAERIRAVAAKTTGFIYTVSVLGVTGTRDQLSAGLADLIQRIQRVTPIPVCVGFGISKPEHAAAVADAGADGVIIGSKLVGLIEEHLPDKPRMLAEVGRFVRQVRQAI